MKEDLKSFEKRKKDHIEHCLNDFVDVSDNSLSSIQLVHEALPDLDFSNISIESQILGTSLGSPVFVSSMTAGHENAGDLNYRFASACHQKNWLFAVGSQRRQLLDKSANDEWSRIRKEFPQLKMLANIGISQLIDCSLSELEDLISSIDAIGLIVHLNPLQEVIQKEGTPRFQGGYTKIVEVAEKLSKPVVVKETGCGFSTSTLQKLASTSVVAVDLSGFGGTHWGRVEGERLKSDQDLTSQMSFRASQVFADWGESTLSSLLAAMTVAPPYEVWASGGVRSGLDVAKFISMGAGAVGMARPFLLAALEGEKPLIDLMNMIEHELKIAMFCTGSANLQELNGKWKWINRN